MKNYAFYLDFLFALSFEKKSFAVNLPHLNFSSFFIFQPGEAELNWH